eukprot:TRINITY_DN294_c0_g1_i1.p1 TRINITY_DN294_c0_g1~~TRINITY_DN294_c0_g1_i1.p1  ORF type:complete len:433 (-),score=100.81 TRINITY_DN294_c0_g1_i1:226-1524(-)
MSDAGGRSKAGSEKKRGRQQETKVVKELKEEDDEGIEVLLVEEEEEGREEEEEEREWPARRTRRERKERRKARSASPAPYSRSTQPSLTDKPEAAEAAAAAGGGGGGERRERGRKRGGSRGAWGRQRSASTGRRSPSRLAGGLESDFQATTLVYAGDLGGPELDELNLDIEKRFGEGWRIVYLEGAMGERDLKAYTNSDKVERMPHYDLAFPATTGSLEIKQNHTRTTPDLFAWEIEPLHLIFGAFSGQSRVRWMRMMKEMARCVVGEEKSQYHPLPVKPNSWNLRVRGTPISPCKLIRLSTPTPRASPLTMSDDSAEEFSSADEREKDSKDNGSESSSVSRKERRKATRESKKLKEAKAKAKAMTRSASQETMKRRERKRSGKKDGQLKEKRHSSPLRSHTRTMSGPDETSVKKKRSSARTESGDSSDDNE